MYPRLICLNIEIVHENDICLYVYFRKYALNLNLSFFLRRKPIYNPAMPIKFFGNV